MKLEPISAKEAGGMSCSILWAEAGGLFPCQGAKAPPIQGTFVRIASAG